MERESGSARRSPSGWRNPVATSRSTTTGRQRARKRRRAPYRAPAGGPSCCGPTCAMRRGRARPPQRLDVVVNSAAIMVRQPVEAVTPESWDATLDLNLRAMFFVAQGAIPHLRRAKGKIVNMADIAGMEPWPAYVPHCVSKAGVVMLTKALARALAPDVAVNAVAPGAVLLPEDWDEQAREHIRETTPLERLGSPADIVAAVRFLLAGTDYATGTVLVVDGGRLIRGPQTDDR